MSRPHTTRRLDIIKTAAELFFSIGYSNTSPKMISKKLHISPGNITYYFPSKEHLLCTMVEMLCDYQWRVFESISKKGFSSIDAICMEMMTVATGCEQSEVARDFFTAVFESQMCRNYLRKNHVNRAKQIFTRECGSWSDQQFHQAEIMVMGIQYFTIAASDADIPLKIKISASLDRILDIYCVDKETRKREIDEMMSIDYQDISEQVLKGFISFMNRTNNEALEEMKETIQKQKNK